MASSQMDDHGVEDAAILLMSLGEEEASEVFKHLAPKEVQRLGEAIARMKAVTGERVDAVMNSFEKMASSERMLVADSNEYVKAVLRKALGDDKANLLIDRILQGSDVTGIESLKWMDPTSVAELLRNLADKTPWLSKPELSEIVASTVALSPRDTRRVANFNLRVRLMRASEVPSTTTAPAPIASAPAR